MKKGYSHLQTYGYKSAWHPIRHIIESFNNASAVEDSIISYFGDTAIKMVRCYRRIPFGDADFPVWELRGSNSGVTYAVFDKKVVNHIPLYRLHNNGSIFEKYDLAVYKR